MCMCSRLKTFFCIFYDPKFEIIKIILIQIAIPKHTSVSCLAWNQQSGYIAVGGDDGMLKVLKLESGKNLTRILKN